MDINEFSNLPESNRWPKDYWANTTVLRSTNWAKVGLDAHINTQLSAIQLLLDYAIRLAVNVTMTLLGEKNKSRSNGMPSPS